MPLVNAAVELAPHPFDGTFHGHLIGTQFALWILLVPVVLFMLWVGHVRRGAALAIFAAACVTALALLWAVYSFRPMFFAKGLLAANWLETPVPANFVERRRSCWRGSSSKTALAWYCCCWSRW